MIIRICAFTHSGWELAETIEKAFPEHIFEKRDPDMNLSEWTRVSFDMKAPIIFIGAAGIAVRSVSSVLRDKLNDSPVLVIDENGKYVIPILSGHVGGANELARQISEKLSMEPVITTGTDVNSKFSVDVFAMANALEIVNRDGIQKVSSKLLESGSISIGIAQDIMYDAQQIPEEINLSVLNETNKDKYFDVIISSDNPDVMKNDKNVSLFFCPSEYTLGIGCKKDTTEEKIRSAVDDVLSNNNLTIDDIADIGTIDIKAKEYGLVLYAQKEKKKLLTYSAEELNDIKGEFTESEFVKDIIGVSNVCERAAVCTAGDDSNLIVRKAAGDGVTVAVARRTVKIKDWSNTSVGISKGNETNNQLPQKSIYIVGIGPGDYSYLSQEAKQVIESSDVIVGYTLYVDLLKKFYPNKEYRTTGMRQEIERCKLCFELAESGKTVSLICSGDAGIYGMASPMFELSSDYPDTELIVVPGITAASSGAAVLGAPLNHDFCVISLSDLLTPWEKIEKRLRVAIEGDFAIAIYNPSSRKRHDYLQKACDIMIEFGADKSRACGYVENIGREGTKAVCCTLKELRDSEVNMFTTVFIGNSKSYISNNRLITKRGYNE